MKRIALGLCMAAVFSLAPTLVQAQTTCLTPLAQMISPTPGSTLPAGAVTFEWCNASADYFLTIESLPGAHNIFFAFVNVTSITLGPACNIPSPTSPTIQCIPDLGGTIYVTLWTQTSSGKTGFQAAPTVTYTAPSVTTTPVATTTSVVSPSVSFSSSAQSITLTATVAATSAVNQGTVTFQVLNGATNVGAAATSATLTNGSATVVYLLPAGTAVGSYTIQASYSGGSNFLASSGIGTLTVNAAPPGAASTTTAIDHQNVSFNSAGQHVTLTAMVAVPGGTVNQGTVTFQVLNGATKVGAAATSATLTNGSASVIYLLPAGTAVGSYTIQASYSGGANFLASSGTATLTVTSVPPPTQTATSTIVSNNAVTFSSNIQHVTLTAAVSVLGGIVNQGTVTFQIVDAATRPIGTAVASPSLTSGSASAIYVLPAGMAAGSYTIQANHSGGTNFLASSGTGTLTVTLPTQTPDVDVFVPIVLSAAGLNGSFFTSEMSLTNRGAGNGTVKFTYTSSIGTGSGEASDTMPAGQQRIVPDAINYLRSLGIPVPSSGNQGGTLRVTFSGLASSSDGGVTVRTTTVVPDGRAGLAYAGITATMALTGPSYICGLRQNQSDRSNVAIQNVGSLLDGNITLRLTVFSGDRGVSSFHVLPDQVLSPGGFVQISGILISNGLSLSNGFVRLELINGKSPYYAYGVINDQVNSDGSFIPPILESSMVGKTRLTLPVVVEANNFSTELVVTNWSSTKKTLNCRYVSDAIQAPNATADFTIDINPSQQLIWPDLVQRLRLSQIAGIGPRGAVLAGALFAVVSDGDLSGISLAARISAPGGGGRYGLFYTAVPEGTASTSEAWLFGLQQNAENRSNLALVNTGEIDINPDTFRVELFDGDTGSKVSTIEGIEVTANRWYQIGKILSQYAAGTSQGYSRITRTAGSNPFIAYAVINDGANPAERSGDGAFIASAP